MTEIRAPQGEEWPGGGRHADLLVGRDEEVARVRSFVTAASDRGGALIVTGEPGVGKTRLLDAAADIAAAGGTRVLRAAGIQFEAEMSYSSLNQVLLPLLYEIAQLPPLQRDALNVALGLGEGTPPSRLVVSNAALALLRQAAADRPLLVILDDLPWLDRASARVLSFVARRLAETNVGLIGASRASEDIVFDHTGVSDLAVEPLDDTASRQLLASRYPDLGSAARERILAEAEGNPLALVELPAALGPGGRRSSDGLPSTLPLGSRLQALFRTRITSMPRATRRLLLRMALDGTGDVRVLEAAADAGLRHLAPAEKARLAYLDESAHRISFHHPLIRSTVVELSQAADRREAHRALADAWSDQPDRRVWHLAEAALAPDESVASQLEDAAARMLARGDPVASVRALTRSADLSPRRADQGRRLAAAAYIAAEVAGDLTNAAHVLAELRRGETEFADDGSLQAAVAASVSLLQGDGDVATAHRLLVTALDGREGTLDARDPVVAEALNSLMMVCSHGGEETLWRSFEDAMARTVDMPLALDLSSRTFADPVHAGAPVLGALESAIDALANESDPSLIVRLGIAATYVDRLEGCRAALWRVVHDARNGGAVASGITAMILLARDELETGAWDEAEQLAAEAVQVAEAHGYHAATWPSRYIQAVVAAGRGDDKRVKELSDQIVRWAGPRGIKVRHWFWHARGLAALGRGDFEDAYQVTSRISPAGILARHAPGALYILMDLVEAATRTGRSEEAEGLVAEMRQANIAALSSRLALTAGGCAAIAAPEETTLDLFRETLALPGIERWRFHLARVRLAYGERLRRHRAMTEARVQLNAALETFQRLNAQPWVDRTKSELRATGQTKPRAGESVLDRLTPQELEIVTLAASGMTNKQIAARLFLSHRTVGGHLHRAFPKLGVATRAALRDALEALPAERLPRA